MRVYKAKVFRDRHFMEIRIVKREGDRWVNNEDIWRRLGYELRQTVGRSTRATWQPPTVAPISGEPGTAAADFSHLNMHQPLALTQRAKDALGEVLAGPDDRTLGEPLGNRGELLPLDGVDGQTYYLYNDPIIDALDEANSAVYRGVRNHIDAVEVYSFSLERLDDAWLFKLPDQTTADFYITEPFKALVEAAGLTNLVLELIWDSDDPDYRDERYDDRPGMWEEVKRKLLIRKGVIAAPPPPPPRPPPKTTEEPLDDEDAESVADMVRAGVTTLKELQTAPTQADEPQRVVEAISAGLEHLRSQDVPRKEREDRAIELGVLYGEQVVQTYGWHWAKIDSDFVVVAPDASLYLDPVYFIFGFLMRPEKDLTVELLFNMLKKPQPGVEAGGYQAIEQTLPST